MSLAEFLTQQGLANYTPGFTSKGFADFDQLLGLPDESLDQLFASLGMLKGHAYKLKKRIEEAKGGEPDPSKRAKLPEYPQKSPMSQMQSKPGMRPVPLTQPVRAPLSSPAVPKPAPSLTKEVERLMAKLAEIEQTREDIGRAKELLLSIDVERYRRSLQQVEFVQKTLRAMEEVSAEITALEGEEMQASE